MPYTISYAALKDKAFRNDIIEMVNSEPYSVLFNCERGIKAKRTLLMSLYRFDELDKTIQDTITDTIATLMNRAIGE